MLASTADNGKIAVLGMGHVGLPTALGLAELGWEVFGADDDNTKLAQIRDARPPFYEPGVPELLHRHLESGGFRPLSSVDQAVAVASVLLVCVGTPQRKDGQADLTQVEAVARTIARNLNGYKLIVEKSTVPAITARWVRRTIRRHAGVLAGVSPGVANGLSIQTGREAEFVDECTVFEMASNPRELELKTPAHEFGQYAGNSSIWPARCACFSDRA